MWTNFQGRFSFKQVNPRAALNIYSYHGLHLRNQEKNRNSNYAKQQILFIERMGKFKYTHIVINSGFQNFDHTTSCVTIMYNEKQVEFVKYI